jgi:hypothetical protein
MLCHIENKQKEAILMNFKKTLVFLSLVLVAISFNVYAVDPLICNSGANVTVHDNGSLKSCELKGNYEANNIQCRERGPVSFYDKGSLESCILSTPTTIGENKCDQFYLIQKQKGTFETAPVEKLGVEFALLRMEKSPQPKPLSCSMILLVLISKFCP